MEFHLKTIGILLIILAFIHPFFPRYFKWKEESRSLSLINRQILYIHTFFIAFVVFLIGLLSLTCSSELTETVFGKKIALTLCIFWSVRLFLQFFGYSSKLWKGKRFETTIHIVFCLFWFYLIVVYLFTYLEPVKVYNVL